MNRNEAGRAVKACRYLNTAEKAVFLALLECANNADCTVPLFATPTVPELALWVSIGRSTVLRALDHLQRHGWLTRVRGVGRGQRSQYRLLSQAPDVSCVCEKVPQRDHSTLRKGPAVTPFVDGKGLVVGPFEPEKGPAVEQKRSRCDTKKVPPAPPFAQVNPGFARREAGKKGEVVPHCDFCDSTDTQVNGSGWRLCREHAGRGWREA